MDFLLDEIALDTREFHAITAAPPRASRPAPYRVAHLALHSDKQQLLDRSGTPETIEIQTSVRLRKPELTDGETTLYLADSLPESSILTLHSNGSGRLRRGSLDYWLMVQERPEAVPKRLADFHLSTHQIRWRRNPPSFRPNATDEACWLQWNWDSPWPITGFEVSIGVKKSSDGQTVDQLLWSEDGEDWVACPMKDGVGSPPQGYRPTRRVFLRYQTAIAKVDWATMHAHAVKGMTVDLELDTRGSRLPSLRHLSYRDASGEANRFRGLVNLKW